MEKKTHHPLRAQADILKKALVLNGFKLLDDNVAPEIESSCWAIKLFKRPAEHSAKPVFLEDGSYALRSELLAAQLPRIGEDLPFKAFSAGRIYDAADGVNPCHTVLQGIWAGGDLTTRAYERFWGIVAQTAYGISTKTELAALEDGSYEARVTVDDKQFVLARAGKATPIARALLGISEGISAWLFEVDVDEVACAVCDLATRGELYHPVVTGLKRFADTEPAFTGYYMANVVNTLRSHGFVEFSGLKVYEADCYQKMNMIQEAWDTNNRGVQLVEPMGNYTGLPTVLTPSLEEALAANWRAGVEECLLFEIGHIFLPGRNGEAPVEKRAVSFGGYGPNLDKVAWRNLVAECLDEFGITNHFFIPLPYGKAPAYDMSDSWLVMDQNMTYLESNFGGISPIALENHGIGTQAFMAQFEYEPIEKKAIDDFNFIPNDYQ